MRTSPGEETQLCVLALPPGCYAAKQNERRSSPSPKHTPFLMRVDPGAMRESRPFPGRLQRHREPTPEPGSLQEKRHQLEIFALMPVRQPAPAPGRRRRKDCRRSSRSPACVYTRGCTWRISAGDPGRRMQQPLSKRGVISCALPERATRSRHGLSPDTAADHPPPDKKAHGGGLARHGCYERTALYDRTSPKDVGRKNSIICR